MVVEVGRDVVLEQFPKVLNNQLRSTGITVLSKTLVDSKNVDQFVGQIVFGAVATVEGDGWANCNRRYREHLENNPLWAVLLVHSNEDEVFSRDAGQPLTNVSWVQLALGVVVLFLEGGRLVQDDFPLGGATVHANLTLGARGDLFHFLDDLGKFSGTNTVLGDDITDTGTVVVLFRQLRVGRVSFLCRVKKNVTARVAGRLQCCLDEVYETDVNNWQFKLDVSKVTR